MKARLMQYCRYIVGDELGFAGEGSYHWYYTVYVAISIIYAWQIRPDIAASYTAVMAAEYLAVCVYGYLIVEDWRRPKMSAAYLVLMALLKIICFILDWKLTLIMLAVCILGILIAPDEEGQSYILRHPEDQPHWPLLTHAIWFGFFAYAVFTIPTDLFTHILIIVAAMAIHPVIDIMEGFCMSYLENILESIWVITDYIDERKYPDDDNGDDE